MYNSNKDTFRGCAVLKDRSIKKVCDVIIRRPGVTRCGTCYWNLCNNESSQNVSKGSSKMLSMWMMMVSVKQT